MDYMLNPEVIKKIVSTELLKHSDITTDFNKFISNGINTFIQTNPDIKSYIANFISENMIQINSISILFQIITNPSLHNAQTQHIIKSYSYFARKMIATVLLDPSGLKKHDRNKCYIQSPKIIEFLQNKLMNNSYFDLPKDLIITIIKTMLEYIKNTIDSIRPTRFHSYVAGHFIESILTETKYYSTVDSLKRCKCVNKENKQWLYTEKDFDAYARKIEDLLLKLKWKNFKGNCYLYSAFPYAYVDYVVKSNYSETKLINDFNELISLIYSKIQNFKLFQKSLKGYIDAVLLLSSKTDLSHISFTNLSQYKKIRFKGSVVTNTPIMFENDMITHNHIIEIKTGATDAKKNMTKLILENIILSISNGRKFKNLIIFNPRSNLVSFISANKFVYK